MEWLTNYMQTHGALSSFSSIAGMGAALVLLGGCWKYILMFYNGVRDILLSRSVYRQEASSAMLSYILAHGKTLRFGMRAYKGSRHFINKIQKVEALGYEDITNEPTLVFLHGRPLIISRGSDKNRVETASTNSFTDDQDNDIHVTTIRSLINLDELLIKALKYYNELHQVSTKKDSFQRRFMVKRMGKTSTSGRGEEPARGRRNDSRAAAEIEHWMRTSRVRLLNWKVEDVGQVLGSNSAFSVFFFPEPVMRLVNEIQAWLKYEKWFKKKGIPWRLGCLFYGKPGTGKSTLISSLALELDLPIFILDLSSMDNVALTEAWEEIQQNAPAIALIEDIDSIFNGRDYVAGANAMRDSLTFDCLLNTISGVKNSDGVLLCVTTNDISKLDPALGIPDQAECSSRPGRIDRAIELKTMAGEERRKVAEYVLKDCPDRIEEVIKLGDGETAAQFQNRCTTIALGHFWKTNKLV